MTLNSSSIHSPGVVTSVPLCFFALEVGHLAFVMRSVTNRPTASTHYNGLKAMFLGRGSGARVVDDVVNAIELKNWGLFADHGLSPSPHDAPSAPVMRILFALIRGDKIVDYYSAMAQLNHSSGSFEGAVFEEQVRYRLLRGSGFRVRINQQGIREPHPSDREELRQISPPLTWKINRSSISRQPFFLPPFFWPALSIAPTERCIEQHRNG